MMSSDARQLTDGRAQMCAHADALIEDWIQKATSINILMSSQDIAIVATLKKAFVGNDQSCRSSAAQQHQSLWGVYLLTFIFSTVFIIGLLGNLLTMAVIYCTPALHSHTNYFLSNLACSDFFLIIFGIPFDLISLWRNAKPPKLPAYCEIMSTSISLFTYSSVLTIVALTAERFVAICYPFNMKILFNKRKVISVIYLSWIIAFIPSLYIGLQFKPVTPDFCGYNRELGDGIGKCDFVASEVIPFQFPFEVNMLLTFVIPVAFILYCYVRILSTLKELSHCTTVHIPIATTYSESIRRDNTLSLHAHIRDSSLLASHQAQKVVIKMLAHIRFCGCQKDQFPVTVTAIFFLCYLPYHIDRLIVHYTREKCDKSSVCLMLYPVTGLLQYFSAAMNPILYNLMSTRFRNAFKGWFRKILRSTSYKSVAR
ncbi:unnamed protein product [Anisakis simplex]|uniref:G_PROTEIN_RECEP_F1_2 domain-containing protein n=1 Tax=Anisakis simplex TaxID=6269 RepID=A0A0M3JZQ4_ANISI|nr:unnamed protein product [Anisakis simplex]